VAGQGSIVCALQIEDGVVCYFHHCLQTADIKQAVIEPVLDGNAISRRDVVTEDESHCHKEEVENNRC